MRPAGHANKWDVPVTPFRRTDVPSFNVIVVAPPTTDIDCTFTPDPSDRLSVPLMKPLIVSVPPPCPLMNW